MNRLTIPKFLFVSALAILSGSCAPTYLGGTAAANDHIMLVRQNPPTFGFQRLSALSARHPDLAIFIGQSGSPDFLAETNKGGNRYLILYYLSSRKAFACRTGSENSHAVEFSGPYPVTEGEFRTLSRLRDPADT